MISSEVPEVLAMEEAPFDRQEKVLRGQVLLVLSFGGCFRS